MNIEKGIPLPPINPTSKGSSVYKFNEMDVGDSVLVSGSPANIDRARTSARVYAHRNGKKFCSRAEGKGARIWRYA